jgi:tetratricopeptide (TPR) repeat protein
MRAAEPDNANWTDSRAAFLHNLAALYEQAGRLDDAEHSHQAALELWTRLLAREPDNPGFLEHLATLHQSLAFLHGRRGEAEKAERANTEALRLRERLVQLDPKNMPWLEELANIQQNIAEVRLGQGRLDDAEAWLDRYQPVRERLAQLDPANAGWQQSLADAYRNRALLLVRRGHDLEAARQQRLAWELSEKLLTRGGVDPEWRRRWRDGMKAAEEVFARLTQRAVSDGRNAEAAELERTLAEIRAKLAEEASGVR